MTLSARSLVCLLLIGLVAHAQAREAVCECQCTNSDKTFSRMTADCTDECSVCQASCPSGEFAYKCHESLSPAAVAMLFFFQIALAAGWAAYIQQRRRRLSLPMDQHRSFLQCLACYCIPCWPCCYLYTESQELNSRAQHQQYQQQQPGVPQGVALAIPVGPDGRPLPAGHYYYGAPAQAAQQQQQQQPAGNPYPYPYVPQPQPQQQQGPVYAAVAVPLPAAAAQQPGQQQLFAGVYPGLAVQRSYAAVPAAPPASGPVFAGEPHRI